MPDPPGAQEDAFRDATTTVSQLRDMVHQFVAERDWRKFHSPKNVAMALAVEAAELMEHFQWIENEQSRQLTAEQAQAVAEELADVVCYALALANELQLDVAASMAMKMVKNRRKYPVDTYRGTWKADASQDSGRKGT